MKAKLTTIRYTRTLCLDVHFGALMRCLVHCETVPENWPKDDCGLPVLSFPTPAKLKRFAAACNCKAEEVPPQDTPTMPELFTGGMVFVIRGAYADPLSLFECSGGGFGCDPEKMGQAVFGRWISSGEDDQVRRGDCIRLATEAERGLAALFVERDQLTKEKAQLDCWRQQSEDCFESMLQAGKRPSRDTLFDAVLLLRRNASIIERYLFDNWAYVAQAELKRRAALDSQYADKVAAGKEQA